MSSDPNVYRQYECNIYCPKIKAFKEFRCPNCMMTSATIDNLTISDSLAFSDTGVKFYSGSFPISTTHTFTSTELPGLGETSCNGELSLYLNNDVYANVTLMVIVRASSTTVQSLIYQRIGNFTSVEATISGNNVVITCNPQATCKWLFRGV
jgi:hypothetical protein